MLSKLCLLIFDIQTVYRLPSVETFTSDFLIVTKPSTVTFAEISANRHVDLREVHFEIRMWYRDHNMTDSDIHVLYLGNQMSVAEFNGDTVFHW